MKYTLIAICLLALTQAFGQNVGNIPKGGCFHGLQPKDFDPGIVGSDHGRRIISDTNFLTLDTIPCLMLISDTSHRPSPVAHLLTCKQFGCTERHKEGEYVMHWKQDDLGFYDTKAYFIRGFYLIGTTDFRYLSESKQPIGDNIIVWYWKNLRTNAVHH
ncbi:MAG: hypothetical protein ACTHLE_03555 [Agriterribacter sp.]